MKTLALIVPPSPPDGADDAFPALLAEALRGDFACTLITRAERAAALPRCAEAAPSYTQRSYRAFRSAQEGASGRFDAALATDGLHPWALAALDGTTAARKLVYLRALPEDYLLPEDRTFFAERFAGMAAVLCENEEIRADFDRLFPELAGKSRVLCPPPDPVRCRRLAAAPCAEQWDRSTADVLAVCRLDSASDVQKLPRLAAAWKRRRPELRWHIAGDGAWRDWLIREIVLADVCDEVELTDAGENAAPLIAQANAYLALADVGDTEAEGMARAMGKPVLHFPPTDEQLSAIAACVGRAVFPEWADRQALLDLFSEEERI